MQKNSHIGIDLGGTNISGGVVKSGNLMQIISRRINAQGSTEDVLKALFDFTDQLFDYDTSSIGIGVPGLVDTASGLVFDVVNIPSWKEVPLQSLMEERYQVPVIINNDANCFALGEYHFGKGKGYSSIVGLTIGTGLGTGIIINKKLYNGQHCGAGEFGMIDYLEHNYEYYASGLFFRNVYGEDGETVFQQAKQGNINAVRKYEEMGIHLGNSIKAILFALAPQLIVIGGSVRHAWPYFNRSMWQSIQLFPFKRTVQEFRIEVSDLENSGVLGAAALYDDSKNTY